MSIEQSLEDIEADLISMTNYSDKDITLSLCKLYGKTIAGSLGNDNPSKSQETLEMLNVQISEIIDGIENRPQDYFSSKEELIEKARDEFPFLPKSKEDRKKIALVLKFKSLDKTFGKMLDKVSTPILKSQLLAQYSEIKKSFGLNLSKEVLLLRIKEQTSAMKSTIKSNEIQFGG